MNMHAIARTIGHRHGREDGLMPETERDGAGHLARNHALVRGAHRRLRRDRHLILARAILGEKTVGLGARGADRRGQHLAEDPLAAKGAQAVSMTRQILDAGIDKLLFERGDQVEPAHLCQRSGRATQKRAHAAFPRAAIRIADVAEKEVLRRAIVAEIHVHFGGWVRHDHEVAAGAEWRVENLPEAGLHQIGVGPADSGLAPRGQLRSWKALTAYEPCDVAGPNENQFFTQHDRASLATIRP